MSERPALVRPSLELEAEILEAAADYREAGEERFLDAEEDFGAWLARQEQIARGEGLRPGRVATQFFLLRRPGRILGSCRVRWELTADLLDEGGHVGYDVRPSERGRGYGTLILALALEAAASAGISRVRVTCDDDNERSRRVIERNGGLLDGTGISDETAKLVRRYWIEQPARRVEPGPARTPR